MAMTVKRVLYSTEVTLMFEARAPNLPDPTLPRRAPPGRGSSPQHAAPCWRAWRLKLSMRGSCTTGGRPGGRGWMQCGERFRPAVNRHLEPKAVPPLLLTLPEAVLVLIHESLASLICWLAVRRCCCSGRHGGWGPLGRCEAGSGPGGGAQQGLLRTPAPRSWKGGRRRLRKSNYWTVSWQVRTLGLPRALPLLLLLSKRLPVGRRPPAAAEMPHAHRQGFAASPAVEILSSPYICQHVRFHLLSRPRSLRACVYLATPVPTAA